MDTYMELTTYPKKTHTKLFYFEKRKKFQKKFFPKIFLKNKHFLEFFGKNIFLFLGLNLEQTKSL